MNKRGFYFCLVLSLVSVAFSFAQSSTAVLPNLPDGVYAEIATPKGTILVFLEVEKAPLTTANFVGLAEGTIRSSANGAPFYDGLVFHRVIANFMIQGGDPMGTGSGGPGYSFSDEFHPDLRHDSAGTLSMANSGPDTNGSQFFITHTSTSHLDDMHSVFGHVVQGQSVVDAVEQGDRIESVKIIRIGDTASKYRIDQSKFDRLVIEGAEKRAAQRAQAFAARETEIRRKWPEAQKSDSGIWYIVTKKGRGRATPAEDTVVTVHYTGSLLDGRVFDSSVSRGEPLQMSLARVIPGWRLAVMQMQKGEKRIAIIPPNLGYGARGYPGVIPPDSFLVFEIELIDF